MKNQEIGKFVFTNGLNMVEQTEPEVTILAFNLLASNSFA